MDRLPHPGRLPGPILVELFGGVLVRGSEAWQRAGRLRQRRQVGQRLLQRAAH